MKRFYFLFSWYIQLLVVSKQLETPGMRTGGRGVGGVQMSINLALLWSLSGWYLPWKTNYTEVMGACVPLSCGRDRVGSAAQGRQGGNRGMRAHRITRPPTERRFGPEWVTRRCLCNGSMSSYCCVRLMRMVNIRSKLCRRTIRETSWNFIISCWSSRSHVLTRDVFFMSCYFSFVMTAYFWINGA